MFIIQLETAIVCLHFKRYQTGQLCSYKLNITSTCAVNIKIEDILTYFVLGYCRSTLLLSKISICFKERRTNIVLDSTKIIHFRKRQIILLLQCIPNYPLCPTTTVKPIPSFNPPCKQKLPLQWFC